MRLDLSKSLISKKDIFNKKYQKKITEIHEKLHSEDKSAGTTWVDYPTNYDKKEFSKILKLAKQIQSNSEVLLVVGIGGSYLGAKAGLDMLPKKDGIEVVFAGTSLDYSDLTEKLEYLKDKEVSVNVISKSGTTVEILVILNVIERFMKNKYKNNYKERIVFTTDKVKGYLRERAALEGIESLSVPDFMGGRYSVLSAVGLLPFAVAGVNIKHMMQGALDCYNELKSSNINENPAYQYAIYRHLVNVKLKKKIELFASFTTRMASFEEWLQQLFAESEGKEGKGLFIATLTYSSDLHSVGQFIQQGTPIVAETFITVENQGKDVEISNMSLLSPIKFLVQKTVGDINKAAYEGTIKAHYEAGVPIAILTIPEISAYYYGKLVYFFEKACAASGYLLEINPFDQPGVEQYKSYMKELLKKFE